MARLLLVAALAGARGASGLDSVGDPQRLQMKDTPSELVSEMGKNFFTYADVPIYHRTAVYRSETPRPWTLELASGATDEELQQLIQEIHTGQMTHPDQGEVPMLVATMTATALMALLERHPGRVKLVEEDAYLHLIDETIDVDDSPLSTQTAYPWGIQDISADVVRGRGAGVNVYVMDTGIRTTHVAFGGRAFAGVDVTSGTLTPCAPGNTTCAADLNGHGTHCAGTVGASTYGVADGANLWAVKVLGDDGGGYSSWSILALNWILSSGVRPAVVSMSLGGAYQSSAEEDSIDALATAGVTVVVAAGNQNDDACNYSPARIPSAITVASYVQGGAKSSFSNYGSCIDVWAPGSGVLSSGHHSDTATYTLSGTSMACPHVSGLAAIMYEAYPTAGSMTASQRWNIITASSRTGWVTGIPTTPATVNLVALADTAPALMEPPYTDTTKLSACQGDCDSDSDCADGLTCFLRDGYTTVPGCSGAGSYGMDYCYQEPVPTPAPPTPAPTTACRTAVPGEECFGHVVWAQQEGIRSNPQWYPGLSPESSFEDFQRHLWRIGYWECPEPCAAAPAPAPTPPRRLLEESTGSDESVSGRAALGIPPSANVQLGVPALPTEPMEVEAEAGIESRSTVIGILAVAAGGSFWALCLWHVLRKTASAQSRGGLDDGKAMGLQDFAVYINVNGDTERETDALEDAKVYANVATESLGHENSACVP